MKSFPAGGLHGAASFPEIILRNFQPAQSTIQPQ